MTYYDLIKKYGKGLGSESMWAAVKRVSDFVGKTEEEDPKSFWKLMKGTYYDMCGGHFDEDFAKWQIKQMFYVDKDGRKRYAPYWDEDVVKSVYEKARSLIQNKEYNLYDFMVVLNMTKSDNYKLYKFWWESATETELDNKFIEAAINWLNDDDSPYGTEKAWLYFNR